MRHRFDIALTAAALAVAGAATPALAQDPWGTAQATAQLGPLAVQLTSLAGQPSPWVTFHSDFLPAINNFSLVEVQAATLPGTNPPASSSLLGPFAPRSLAADSALAWARADVLGFGTAQAASFEATGGAVSGDGLSWFMAGVNGPYTGYGAWFSLSPHTELVISARGVLEVEGSGGNEVGISETNAYAHAWMSFTGPPAYGGGGSQSDLDVVSLWGTSTYGGLPFDEGLVQMLEVRFVNGTDVQMDARFEFSVYATGTANPVPEPASWALMLGGLALVGAALRRR